MALFWRGPLTFGFFALLLVVVAMVAEALADLRAIRDEIRVLLVRKPL
jgi:hypothetical protein